MITRTLPPGLAGARDFLKRRKAAHVTEPGSRGKPISPDILAATALIGATLGREPALIDQLLDGPPLVLVVEAPDGAWADAMAKAARACFGLKVLRPVVEENDETDDNKIWARHRNAASYGIYVYSNGTHSPAMSGESSAASAIAEMNSVIGIAATPRKDLPDAIVRAADRQIVSGRLDADLLAMVVAAVAGSRPSIALSAELYRHLELKDLRLAVHRDRGPDGCIARLENMLRPRAGSTIERPRLENLHGYGAAREWGLAAAEDIRAFARGNLPASSLPKGAVFWGPSGTGKTLLAASIAAQAGVPLVVGSLGRWQSVGEAHLGTTCKAMRQFFADARSQSPCIAFVDELDSFGDRASFREYNKDYSTQIVNNFLECLDGAEQRDGVVLLGATNLPNRIDPAIVRAGRFDRMIEILLPSKPDLELILRHHLGSDLPDTDLDEVARRSLGGTGADCAALVRRARSRARRHARSLELADLLAEIQTAGEPMDPKTERRIAIHESGHALAGHLLGFDIGSVVLRSADPNRRAFANGSREGAMTPDMARELLCVFLAGRAAEILVLGSPSTGAASDLEIATAIAWDANHRWGFGERLSVLPPRSTDADPSVVEEELQRAAIRAEEILTPLRGTLERIADALIERSTLEGHEVLELVAGAGPAAVPCSLPRS